MSVFKMKNGKWVSKFRYKDKNGKTKQKKKEGFATKREAQAFEKDFLEQQKKVNMAKPAEITFEDWAEEYLKSKKVKVTTIATKKHIIKEKLIPYFGDRKLTDITVEDIDAWSEWLMKKRTKKGKGYEDTYLRLIRNQLSAIFNHAIRKGRLQTNPVRAAEPIGKKKAKVREFWTKEEFDCFVKAVSDKPLSVALFTLLFYSGMREGEALALTLNDFDFDSNKISICKTYTRLHGEDLIQPPKTEKSNRTIFMPLEVMQLVKEYSEMLHDLQPTDRLFPVTKHYLNKEMKRGTDKSGVKRIHIHDIRHSHASLLVHLGYEPIDIADRLGHESIKTTLDIYSHLYPCKQKQIAEGLSGLL